MSDENLLILKAAQRHAIVTIDGLDITWHTMTGGGRTVEAAPDPESEDGRILATGKVTAENIVLTTSFSPYEDLTWVHQLKTGVGALRVTVTRHWTDENWDYIGDPEVYPDCLLIGYENPTTAPSGDDVEFAITLATTGEAL